MKPAILRVCPVLPAAAALVVSVYAARAAVPDILIADFESDTYGDWQATGTAFGPGPARGTLPNQMPVEGFRGSRLVNSYYQGDGTVGTLTSPPFPIQRRYIRFLIGGGKHPGQTCINLVIDGQTVRTATGPNDRPGGSERLEWQSWDVHEFAGKPAIIRVVDEATGGWGHINVDEISQTDRKLPGLVANPSRELRANRRYLHLPVKNGATRRQMKIRVDDALVREFDIELADAEPDWWAFMDLVPFKGKTLRLSVDALPEDSAALSQVRQSNAIEGAADLYREPLRPQFHFSSRRGWNNDPNGLVYYQGEYHLFYQHNPYGRTWGNMHWGHAVSRDLVHWRELPEALYPDEHGTMFSGSAVVDWNNTAGFRTGKEAPLVCIFTAAGKPFTQGLAFSNDRGRTWTKYSGNPVVPHIRAENRDPKVIWHASSSRWIMALYLDANDFTLLASPDLRAWEPLSNVRLEGSIECPEFFEIEVAGRPGESRWIFYGGNGRYLVGRFDGRTFTPESGPHELHHGNCFYASQTFTDIPKADGRRILVPWGQVELTGMPFNQMMGIPVSLSLRATPEGLRLAAYPVKELQSLRREKHRVAAMALDGTRDPLAGVGGELLDLDAEFAIENAREIRLIVRGEPVVIDAAAGRLRCRDKSAPLRIRDGRVRLRALVDRASIDLFGNEGETYMPMGVILDAANRSLKLESVGGAARILSMEVHELRSAWR